MRAELARPDDDDVLLFLKGLKGSIIALDFFCLHPTCLFFSYMAKFINILCDLELQLETVSHA